MQLLQSLALLATFALPILASALPSPYTDVVAEIRASNSTDGILAAQDVTTGFMCTNSNFGGQCATFQLNTKTTCCELNFCL